MCDSLWSSERAAEFLGIMPSSLRRWRSKHEGPAFVRVGNKVRYDPEDVRAWVSSRKEGG
ncbi:helix-turn-helix transcriptional regulator [Bifidobacterium sp.]|uniref:helix-turn-helix transcriptional regulator n=1 Tax=Bifidobacterium sp. TaxID=41200 RepID=UPI0039E831C3